MIPIKLINNSRHAAPSYTTNGAAGLDIRANLDESIVLQPLERKLIPTGLFVEIPMGYEIQIRPRSGLAFKHGVTVLNTPGTIDSDYRGEIGVLLINLSSEPFVVEDGERVAQMVVAEYAQATWSVVSELSDTERGAGGFGSTGIN